LVWHIGDFAAILVSIPTFSSGFEW